MMLPYGPIMEHFAVRKPWIRLLVKPLLSEKHSIRWYWALGTRYWCLSEFGVDFTRIRIVKFKKRKKFPSAST